MDWDRFFEASYGYNLDTQLRFIPNVNAEAWEVVGSSAATTFSTCRTTSFPADESIDIWLERQLNDARTPLKWPDWKLTVLVLERATSNIQDRPLEEREAKFEGSGENLRTVCLAQSSFNRLFEHFKLPLSFLNILKSGHSVYSHQHQEHLAEDYECLQFTARTTSNLLNDTGMALALRHDFSLGRTLVLLHGCSSDRREYLLGLLRAMSDHCGHPLVVMCLFFEIYHQQMWDLEVTLRLQYKDHAEKVFSGDTGDSKDYNARLKTVTAICDELFALEVEITAFRSRLERLMSSIEFAGQETAFVDPDRKRYMKASTGKMKDRLVGLRDDIDLLQTKCATTKQMLQTLMASMGSIFALVESEISHRITVAGKRDSTIMMSITVGTLTFLPATAIATIFAMPFLPWNIAAANNGSTHGVLSTYLKVSLPLTGGTLVLLFLFMGVVDYENRGTGLTLKQPVKDFLRRPLGVLNLGMKPDDFEDTPPGSPADPLTRPPLDQSGKASSSQQPLVLNAAPVTPPPTSPQQLSLTASPSVPSTTGQPASPSAGRTGSQQAITTTPSPPLQSTSQTRAGATAAATATA